MEGDPQQATFAATGDPARDVEERPFDEGPVAHDPDPSGLFGHEDPAAPVAGIGHIERRIQAAGHDVHDRDDAGRVGRSGRGAGHGDG